MPIRIAPFEESLQQEVLMGVTAYSPCPGGLDKKVKFCCSDLVHDLDKIDRMESSQQTAGSLEYIERLEKKHPDRACLLIYKTNAQMALGRREEARETLASILKLSPHNPSALALSAVLEAESGDSALAVEKMQDALTHSGNRVKQLIADWYGSLGRVLFVNGHIVASIQHLLTHQLVAADDENDFARDLAAICGSPTVPPLLKEMQRLRPPPEDAPYKEQFETAYNLARTLRWTKAADQFEQIGENAAADPAYWWNVATIRGWLAQEAKAADAWRRFAELDVPDDEKIEAEAAAMLLDGSFANEQYQQVALTYSLGQLDEIEAAMDASNLATRLPADPAQFAESDEPPPKAIFQLFDRPALESGANAERSAIPEILGTLFLFGKETDREARCEAVTWRDDRYEDVLAALQAIDGEKFAEPTSEEALRPSGKFTHVLTVRSRLPADTPKDKAEEFRRETLEECLFRRLPELKVSLFDEKTVAEAAAQPDTRRAVQAVLHTLEQMTAGSYSMEDFDRLREQLSLPSAKAFEITNENDLPAVRLSRLRRTAISGLSSDVLEQLATRAARIGDQRLLAKIAQAIVSRDDWTGTPSKATAHGIMASAATEKTTAIEHLHKAQQAADTAGESSAPWDLEELVMRIMSGDAEDVRRIVGHIQDVHAREPNVMAQLLSCLMEFGIISQESLPQAGVPLKDVRIDIKEPEEQTSKIWTPDDERPQGEKAALWVPGS